MRGVVYRSVRSGLRTHLVWFAHGCKLVYTQARRGSCIALGGLHAGAVWFTHRFGVVYTRVLDGFMNRVGVVYTQRWMVYT